jgi:hypothetical protein
MRPRICLVPLIAWLALAPSLVSAAHAQSRDVTSADVERLDREIADVDAEVAALRARHPELADRLTRDLDDLRDEVIYLRVKVRKEGVSRSEFEEVESRIASLRRSASAAPGTVRSDTGAVSGTVGSGVEVTSDGQARRSAPGEIPVGQELDVRLQSRLSSETAQVEDRFEATTLVDLYQGEDVLVPAGSVMRGVISSVEKAGRLDRKGSLTLAFDQLTVRGVAYPIRATVTQAIESKGIKSEGARLGIGAAAGAILGGIIGGAEGAIAGIFIGSGGVLAAMPGKDVEVPAGSVLRVRFDSPATVR